MNIVKTCQVDIGLVVFLVLDLFPHPVKRYEHEKVNGDEGALTSGVTVSKFHAF